MPTVLRLEGLRVVIYPNDHHSAHAHVKGAGGEAVFVLNCPSGPPALRESFGFARPKLNAISAELTRALGALCAEWSRIHDGDR